jgi:hypothetical protein
MIDSICVNDVLLMRDPDGVEEIYMVDIIDSVCIVMTNVDMPSTKKYLYSLRNTDYNELSIVSKL